MSDRGRSNSAARMQTQHDRHQHRLEHVFEDAIMTETGVQCQVKEKDGKLFLRCRDYVDFVLALSVIKGRTSLEIEKA